jgi:hypothetical protein
LLGLAVDWALANAAEPVSPAFDPSSIRRVLISPDRVPAELERVRQGVLVQLSREDFEARVKRAVQGEELRKNRPRLVEAHYRASLVDTVLVGTGQWKILNRGTSGAVLPVQPLTLALQKIRMQKAPLDPTDAVIGDLDGRMPGLLVEQPGDHTAFLDWTARGDADGGNLHFDWQVPPCAIGSLELNTPTGKIVTVASESCLVSGPFPAETPDRRTWRVDFANRSQFDLMVRPQDAPKPLLLAQLENRQDLRPDSIQAEFDFKVEVPHGGVRELVFECDSALRPYEVEVANLETWQWQPPRPPARAATLTVHLRQTLRGGSLRLRCLAPLPADSVWNCPSVRLAGAIDRGETIVLRLPAESQLTDWHAGDFRLTSDTNDGDRSHKVMLTRVRPTGERTQRPRARLTVQEPEVHIRESAWWDVGSISSVLNVQLTFDIARGRLFQLPARLPQGWQVDQVKLTPNGLLRQWNVVQEKGETRLIVDLYGAMGPGTSGTPGINSAQLIVRLLPEAPAAGHAAARGLLPQMIPLVGHLREASLAINLDQSWEAEIDTEATASTPGEKGPWGRRVPELYFIARGQPVDGTLTLRPRRSRVQARCNSEIIIAAGGPVMVTRLSLDPQVGNPETIDLAWSAPLRTPLNWKIKRGSARIRNVKQVSAVAAASWLSLFSVRQPLEAGSLLTAQNPAGDWYRITFSRPLQEPSILEASFELTPSVSTATAISWPVPLPMALNADTQGEVAISRSGGQRVQVQTRGLAEVPANSQSGTNLRWRKFHYGPLLPSLTLQAPVPAANRTNEAMVERAQLSTRVDRGGKLFHHYVFQVSNWRQRVLPVRLPAGSRAIGAKADDRCIADVQMESTPDGLLVVSLPMKAASLQCLEIFYVTEGPAWNFWTRLEPPVAGSREPAVVRPWEPELPTRSLIFQHKWKLPPGIMPLTKGNFCRLPDGPDEARQAHLSSTAYFSGDETGILSSALPISLEDHWVEWEPWTGELTDGALTLVRTDVMAPLGISLAAALLSVAWFLRRRTHALRSGVLFICLSLSVAGLLLLPQVMRPIFWWPASAGVIVVFFWYVSSILARLGVRKVQTNAVAGVLGLVWVSGLPGQATAPIPLTVYLLPAPAEAGKQTVLASPELLEQLRFSSGNGSPMARHALFTRARYEGTVAGTSVEWKGEFQIACLADEPCSLFIPLAGIRLEDAILDGAPAHLQHTKAGPEQESYSLTVEGKGTHTLQLHFNVGVAAKGEDRDVKFAIPELVQSHLVLNLPPGVRLPHALGYRGLHRLQPVGDPGDPTGWRLEVDLGRTNTVHARWREETGPVSAPMFGIHEAYLWSIRPDTATLSAVIQYTVHKGAVTTLDLDLPDELEMRSIGAGRLPGEAIEEAAPRLLHWDITKGERQRRLRLTFQRPVTGGVQVMLEMVPRQPLASNFPVPLPAPRDAGPAEGATADHFLAYRVEGLNAHVAGDHLRITGIDPQPFLTFWHSARMGDPGLQVHAYSFRRNQGSPFLRLILQPRPSRITALEEIDWTLGRRRAVVRLVARLTAPDRDLLFGEWDVPKGITVTEVSGADLRSWSQTGTRLQIWWERCLTAGTLQVIGSQTLTEAMVSKPHAPESKQTPITFSLAPFRAVGTSQVTTYLHVTAGQLRLQADWVTNLFPLPYSTVVPGEFDFVTQRADYSGQFVLEAAGQRGTGSSPAVQSTEREPRSSTSQAPVNSSPPVQVVLADRVDSVGDGRRWLHQVTYTLYYEAGMDVTAVLPEGARLAGALLDGSAITCLPLDPKRFWLPLSGTSGKRRLCLKWVFDEQAEPVDHPRLEDVTLAGATDSAILRTIYVPNGYRIETVTGEEQRSDAASLELQRVDARRHGASPDLLSATPRSPDRRQVFEVRWDDLPEYGTPTYWQAATQTPAPTIRLLRLQEEGCRKSWLLSAAFVLLLFATWLISLSRTAVALVQSFWPEQIVLLGCVVWMWSGAVWISLGLVLMGLIGRLAWLTRWLATRFRPAKPAPAAEPGG